MHLVNSSLNSPRHINKALLRDDVTLVLEHLRALLTLPLELGPALALGLRVLNKPLRDLTLPLIDVGAHSVRLVLEAGEARLAVVHEAVDPCAVHQLSLAIRTGGTALHFAFGLLFFLFFLFCFLLQNLLALSLQPRVTVICKVSVKKPFFDSFFETRRLLLTGSFSFCYLPGGRFALKLQGNLLEEDNETLIPQEISHNYHLVQIRRRMMQH